MRLPATLLLCLLVPTYVEAKPSQWPVTEFAGDRYVARVVTQKAAPVRYSAKARYLYRVKKKTPTARYKRPVRPYVSPTLAQGFVREVRTAAGIIGGRPAGCPARAWCGCWLASHLGMPNRSLWLARNWARIGSASHGPQVGAVVVWRHHVGRVTAVDGHRIRVLSGNDGRRVRDRWRTTRGVIAYRMMG